jgi:DNA-binding MarR family transcriptional regulator
MDRHTFHEADEPSGPKRILEVAERDIRAAKRLLSLVAEASETRIADEIHARVLTPEQTRARTLLSLARKEFENRRSRRKVFGSAMFGEPAWEMLLALYINDASGPRQTSATLLHFSGSSASTGKRWMRFLLTNDLVSREPHPVDARTYFVMLTDKARGMIETYLSGTIDRHA